MSLFLFGEVHKEHWKTEAGTVIGILNPNLMKPKEGYDGVSGCVCVFKRTRQTEREIMCVCLRERDRQREKICVCL